MILSNVLLLGDGYVGNHLFDSLTEVGHKVTKKSSKELNYHDKNVLTTYLRSEDFDTVVNCSGFTGRPNIDEAEEKKELCWFLNVLSPLGVNKCCQLLAINYIHVSSGCIYDGYETKFTETDSPNFGLFSNESSFYSKSKHAFEIHSEEYMNTILRIRMPFAPDNSERNYLSKIRKYNNLIQYKNSKTYIPDLCGVVDAILQRNGGKFNAKREIFNVVNSEPLWTTEVIGIMKQHNDENPDWKIVDIADIDIKAGRSNCILDGTKLESLYKMKTEKEALHECFKK